MPLADFNFNEIVASYSTAAHDVWGVQPYRGGTFGDLFKTFISEKPLLVSEYGMDAYNDVILSNSNVDCLTIVCCMALRSRLSAIVRRWGVLRGSRVNRALQNWGGPGKGLN